MKKQALFENVKSDIVFRVACWKEGRLEFQTGALHVAGLDRKVRRIEAKERQDTVCLLSKYEIYDSEGFTRLMVNGVFEGCNDPVFRTANTLAVIHEAPVAVEKLFVPGQREEIPLYPCHCNAPKEK